MKTLIALGGSIESLPILRRAKELGLNLIVVDGNPAAPGFALADRGAVASCYSPEETINALKSHSGKIDGVICAAVDSPNVAAAVAEALGLPGLTVEQAGLGADKYKQAEALREAGIPIPDFVIVDELTRGANVRLLDLTGLLWDGAVIKPLDSRGARGVIRLLPDVDPAWAYEQARSQSPTGRVMVEEWLGGPQLSTESLVQDGEVLFTAVGLRNYSRLDEFAPHVVEDGFDEPAPLGLMDWDIFYWSADRVISDSCKALGWFQKGGGVVKGDLVIHNGKLHVIELAPRLSGGLFCAAHELCYGVDFIGAAINMALGYTIEAPKSYPRQFVSQRYVIPKKEDVGRKILALPPLPGRVVSAHFSKQVGYVIQPVTSHPDRIGQVTIAADSPGEARRLAEATAQEMYEYMELGA